MNSCTRVVLVCLLLSASKNRAVEGGTSEYTKSPSSVEFSESQRRLEQERQKSQAAERELQEVQKRINELVTKQKDLAQQDTEKSRAEKQEIEDQLRQTRERKQQKEEEKKGIDEQILKLQSSLANLIEVTVPQRSSFMTKTRFENFIDALYVKLQSIRTQLAQLCKKLFMRSQKINEMKVAAQSLVESTQKAAQGLINENKDDVAKVLQQSSEKLMQGVQDMRSGGQAPINAAVDILTTALIVQEVINIQKIPSELKEAISEAYTDLFTVAEISKEDARSLKEKAGIADTSVPQGTTEISIIRAEYENDVADLLKNISVSSDAKQVDALVERVLRNFDRLKQIDPVDSDNEFLYFLVSPMGEAQAVLLSELSKAPPSSDRALQLLDKWAALHERYREGVELIQFKMLSSLPEQSVVEGQIKQSALSAAKKMLADDVKAFQNEFIRNDARDLVSAYSRFKKRVDEWQKRILAAPITRASLELQQALLDAHQQLLDILKSSVTQSASAPGVAAQVLKDTVSLSRSVADDISQLVVVKEKINFNENIFSYVPSAARQSSSAVLDQQFDVRTALAKKDQLSLFLSQQELTADQKARINYQLNLATVSNSELVKKVNDQEISLNKRAAGALEYQKRMRNQQSLEDAYAKSGFSGLYQLLIQPQVPSFIAILKQGQSTGGRSSQVQGTFSGLPFGIAQK